MAVREPKACLHLMGGRGPKQCALTVLDSGSPSAPISVLGPWRALERVTRACLLPCVGRRRQGPLEFHTRKVRLWRGWCTFFLAHVLLAARRPSDDTRPSSSQSSLLSGTRYLLFV